MEEEDDVVKPVENPAVDSEQCAAAAPAAEGGGAVVVAAVDGGESEIRVEERLVEQENVEGGVKMDELREIGEDLGVRNGEEIVAEIARMEDEQGKEVVEGDEVVKVEEEEELKAVENVSKGEEIVVNEEEEEKEKEEESERDEFVTEKKEEEKEEESRADEDEDVIVEKKGEDDKSMEEAVEGVKQEQDESKGVSEEQVMVNDGENELKPDEEMGVEKSQDEEFKGDWKGGNELKPDEEMNVEKLEDDEPKGDGKEGELVGEQEDDIESKGDDDAEEEEEEDEEMGEEGKDEELNDDDDDSQANANESSPVVTKDEEETPTGETEMEVETVKSGSNGGKRRKGRNSKAGPARTPVRKTVGEDVCFICLDGGDLVLCDRRGCPKAYHPLCVDHDEEFFKTKDRWTCGWHLCNKCGKNAHFMCYTCTFSLCKGCCKDAVVFCVRGNKGFCESCMKTVMMIESTEQNEGQVAFDDKSSWEYLFKDYWIEQKRKFSITSDELAQARNPWKSSNTSDKPQTVGDVHMSNNDIGSDTDSSSEKDVSTARRKSKRKLKSQTKEAHSDSEHASENEDASNKKGKRPRRLTKSRSKDRTNVDLSGEGGVEWASKELLEFVMHMKDGDSSVLTQFDVQGLLLEYIKRNKLRDPRRRSQIICDPMLQKLFGKPRVGHFEMLKLLESHFLLKEDSQADDNHGSVVDEVSQLDADDYTDSTVDAGKSKGRKSRKRGEDRGLPSNLDDYAAIDMHNINLIYLRRNLMEALMEDSEAFHDKVVGAFVRIRISGNNLKQDIYRLVQIIGTSKAAEPYRVGKRTTDVMLEILNLDKTEIVSIDSISNQEFTEDECKRLRQSIKCGLISRMTVGDVLEKARELQEVRVTDWLEAEIVRLSHLRDRASEKGRKKELRECVEKLQLLKTPEERQRRLEEIPVVHADPKMDPNYESEDESEKDNRRRGSFNRPRESGFFRRDRDRDRDHFTPRKGSNDSWSANARPPNKNREFDRNLSGKGFSNRRDDTFTSSQTNEHTWDNGVDKGTTQGNSWEKPRLTSSDPLMNNTTRTEYSGVLRSDMSAPALEASHSQPPSGGAEAKVNTKVNDTEKIWHYRDPTNKVQGPFSMSQLRKWSNTGYFPADLKIWKASQSENESFLLTEALAGRFLSSDANSSKPSNNVGSSIENPRNPRGSEYGGVRYDSSSNLPSPTPGRSTATKWSTASSSSPFRSNSQFQRGIERLPSPTPTSPLSVPSGVDRSNFSSRNSSVMGNKEEASSASIASATASSVAANSTGQFYSTSVPRPALPVANQANLRPDVSNNIAVQGGYTNVVQPPTGAMQAQPHPMYNNTQGGWAPPPGNVVARPEMVNPNMMPNNTNTTVVAPPQVVPYPQWTGAPVVANQAPSYGAAYPPPNFPVMPPQNAWGPTPTNMPWGGQMGQMVAPPPMPSGNMMPGWPGPGPTNSNANATVNANANPNSNPNQNQGWMAATSGNANTWTGDQNRRGGGGPQWNRGGGGGGGAGPGTPRGQGQGQGQGVCWYHESGHCKKGSSCNYMHS